MHAGVDPVNKEVKYKVSVHGVAVLSVVGTVKKERIRSDKAKYKCRWKYTSQATKRCKKMVKYLNKKSFHLESQLPNSAMKAEYRKCAIRGDRGIQIIKEPYR